MKTAPIEPALIEFAAQPDGPPLAPRYGDIYHPRVGALAQARHVFLQGNQLPQRWAGCERFTVVETGFGLGNNFLATWDAWRGDAQRCARLHYLAVEKHPPSLDDLRRAQAGTSLPDLAAALLQAWPPLTPNLHVLDFEDGRVQLLLALGDASTLLPALRLAADAIYLDGFSPARNADMWQARVLKALGRLAAPGATAATWSVAAELRAGLTTAGFELRQCPGIGGKREITVARHAPRHVARPLPGAAVAGRNAVVVGAGLAGAAVAQALAQQGLLVTVLERHAEPALEASSNPAGIFHGTVNADDGSYARLFRAGALAAQAAFKAAFATGVVPGRADGLLRLHTLDGGLPAMLALLARVGLPRDYVQALSAEQASALAGVALPAPAWLYPGGGWVSPRHWVRHALSTPGVQSRYRVTVEQLVRDGDGWCLQGPEGQPLARAPIVVLANAGGAASLLAPLGHAGWPLQASRGQVTHWQGREGAALRLPVAGDGYALPLPGGLLCGATRQPGDLDGCVREADHHHNLQRLQRLTGLVAPADASAWQGRVGWRLASADRLPMAGAMPLATWPAGQRLDQARLLPRERGLFVLTALGARGLTLAPLLARLVAAQATGAPWPLEQDLADAVDPARWLVRSARSGAAAPTGVQPG